MEVVWKSSSKRKRESNQFPAFLLLLQSARRAEPKNVSDVLSIVAFGTLSRLVSSAIVYVVTADWGGGKKSWKSKTTFTSGFYDYS